ncbi:MAG: hypothetical protein RI900_1724 [Actinomycetota bacterium]|jgi:hypothetical protein
MPRPGAVPVLTLAVVGAVFLCVPETDHLKGVALLLIGVAAVEVLADEVLPFGWHAFILVVVLWAGLWGASGRSSAVVGAVFAGWVLLLPALISAAGGYATPPRRTAVCVISVLAATVVARTGALDPTLRPAVVWAAAAAVGSLLSSLVLVRVGTPTPRRR